MTPVRERAAVSAIVPTIGRPASLARLLESLAAQSAPVTEVLVADAGPGSTTAELAHDPRWNAAGLRVRHLAVDPPNAVRQRRAAIAQAAGEYLLLLDDDVVLEPDCVEQLLRVLRDDASVAAACADFSNHPWSMPTRAWRLYLRYVLGLEEGAWQGRVVGPLLRFGFHPTAGPPRPMEWFGAGHTLLRRDAYDRAGGFSDHFLHRCTTNEDVDLALKVGRFGRIVFCPAARLGHFHDAAGRVSPLIAAEDDLYNRFVVMRRTQGRSTAAAFGLALLYFAVETSSNLAGCLRRLRGDHFLARAAGRARALARIAFGSGGGA